MIYLVHALSCELTKSKTQMLIIEMFAIIFEMFRNTLIVLSMAEEKLNIEVPVEENGTLEREREETEGERKD
jgi:hypothetical protein